VLFTGDASRAKPSKKRGRAASEDDTPTAPLLSGTAAREVSRAPHGSQRFVSHDGTQVIVGSLNSAAMSMAAVRGTVWEVVARCRVVAACTVLHTLLARSGLTPLPPDPVTGKAARDMSPVSSSFRSVCDR
jgi:hypothetical protein